MRLFRICQTTAAAVLLFSLPWAQAGQKVAEGDLVSVHFTCRIKGGPVLTTTDQQQVADAQKASNLFLPRIEYAPAMVVAGANPAPPVKDQADNLHDAIARGLAPALVGLEVGGKTAVKITAEAGRDLPETERFVKIARRQSQEKQLAMPLEEFKETFTGVTPRVGVQLPEYVEGYTATVAAMAEETVTLAFAPVADVIDTPFGKGRVRETAAAWVVEVAAEKGHLMRVGPHLAVVSAIDEDFITYDFSHPFGGKELVCDTQVVAAAKHHPGAGTDTAGQSAADQLEKTAKFEAAREFFDKAFEMARQSPDKTANIDMTKANPTQTATAPENRIDASAAPDEAEKPGVVQAGDLVRVAYTARTADGKVVYSTRPATMAPPVPGDVIAPPAVFEPEVLIAGRQGELPGIGAAVIGAKAKNPRRVAIPPEKAFGPRDPKKVISFPRERKLPKINRMPLATYARLVGKTPYVGAIVDLNPYFKSEVKAVTAEVVVVVALAENGSHTDELGTVDIRVGDTEVTMVANPKPGAVFAMENLQGKVTAVDDKSFTVDFNHPLAGKAYTLEFEVVSLVKRSALAGLTIAWIEDHDKGMAQAAKTGKPVVMVLWADWCQYCEKLLNDVMPDPRIGELKDRFVWVKINSDKEKQVKALYDQRGFPLTLVLTAKGEVLHSIDGLTDAKSLRRQLTGVLNQIKLGKAVTPKPAQKG